MKTNKWQKGGILGDAGRRDQSVWYGLCQKKRRGVQRADSASWVSGGTAGRHLNTWVFGGPPGGSANKEVQLLSQGSTMWQLRESASLEAPQISSVSAASQPKPAVGGDTKWKFGCSCLCLRVSWGPEGSWTGVAKVNHELCVLGWHAPRYVSLRESGCPRKVRRQPIELHVEGIGLLTGPQ